MIAPLTGSAWDFDLRYQLGSSPPVVEVVSAGDGLKAFTLPTLKFTLIADPILKNIVKNTFYLKPVLRTYVHPTLTPHRHNLMK